VSAVGAALAILTAPAANNNNMVPTTTTTSRTSSSSSSTTVALVEYSNNNKNVEKITAADHVPQQQQQQQQYENPAELSFWDSLWGKSEPQQQQHSVEEQEKELPLWMRWILQAHKDKEPVASSSSEVPKFLGLFDLFSNDSSSPSNTQLKDGTFWMLHWLDPNILRPDQDTFTGLIDKVLTSTVRLLLIANWLMALTVLLHTAVADWFLGSSDDTAGNDRSRRGGNVVRARDAVAAVANPRRIPPAVPPVVPDQQQWTSAAAGGRERMGGFLVFKLLLISAVVAPDTLDLLILLSWYTVLSFLRSLAALCAQQTDLARTLGQTPAAGVWKLLVTVLGMDLTAATVCVALFHGAGLGMVLLLTCDCALLAVDVITHILRHFQLAWEVQHAERIGLLEDEQTELHQRHRDNRLRGDTTESDDQTTTEEMSRELDRQMELLEQQHARKTSIVESTVFGLQLFTDLLTVAHFMHIWTLHGVQFTLIDGVLVLHLHSALSSASKKIAERRNMNRIARDMDGMFEDASELDLRKAAESGDVCCICLGTMCYFHTRNSNFNNNVKKVACGHLYHTVCLREVVERARSMEEAKCPLCRSYVVSGRHRERGNSRRDINNGTQVRPVAADPGAAGLDHDGNFAANFRDPTNDLIENREANVGRNDDAAVIGGAGEQALFRFSTEGMFPAWIPLPAFSFEVVRRPAMTAAAVDAEANGARATETDTNNGARNADDTAQVNNNANDNERRDAAPHNQQQSLLRRLLLLAGAIPMSPAEERAAMDQLVDMFPQYNRQDLLRALRERGSSEAVAEAILLGVFIGVPRGMVAR
jgi:hypothetical protein